MVPNSLVCGMMQLVSKTYLWFPALPCPLPPLSSPGFPQQGLSPGTAPQALPASPLAGFPIPLSPQNPRISPGGCLSALLARSHRQNEFPTRGLLEPAAPLCRVQAGCSGCWHSPSCVLFLGRGAKRGWCCSYCSPASHRESLGTGGCSRMAPRLQWVSILRHLAFSPQCAAASPRLSRFLVSVCVRPGGPRVSLPRVTSPGSPSPPGAPWHRRVLRRSRVVVPVNQSPLGLSAVGTPFWGLCVQCGVSCVGKQQQKNKQNTQKSTSCLRV